MWARVMELALARHADAPSVDQVCAIVREKHPKEPIIGYEPLFHLAAAAELRETAKQVAYLREMARDRGWGLGLSIAAIRARSCKPLYRRTHYPKEKVR